MGHAAAFVRTVRRGFTRGSARVWTFVGALAFGFCVALLVLAAPAARRQLDAIASGAAPGDAGWALGLAASGLALLGVAAVVFVLAHLLREAEARPYASLAPVLAVFSASVLIGLRAPLPLPGIASEIIAVFALLAAVSGGALVRAPTLSAQLGGLGLALFPALSLAAVLWAATGELDPARALGSLAPRGLAFLAMLLASSFGVALIATLGRAAAPVHAARPAERVVGLLEPGGAASWRAVFLGVVALAVACAGLCLVLGRAHHGAAEAPRGALAAEAPAVPAASPPREPEPVVAALPARTEHALDAPPPGDDAPATGDLPIVRVTSPVSGPAEARLLAAGGNTERVTPATAHGREARARPRKSKVARHHARERRRAALRRTPRAREAPPPWGDVLSQVPARTRHPGTRAPEADQAEDNAPQVAAQRASTPRRATADGSLDDLMSRALAR